MRTVRFTYYPDGYKCSEPGEQDGEYVKAEVAAELLEACKMVLLFHSGSPWDDTKREAWFKGVTAILSVEDAAKAENNPEPVAEATTRVLCETIRTAIRRADERSAK